MLKQFFAALAGGLMIAIGGCVYLNSIMTMNSSYFVLGSAVGAFFFSVALICICLKGYGLYTGRVGYLPDHFSGREAAGLGMTLLGNAVATFLVGALVSLTMPEGMGAVAYQLCVSKIAATFTSDLGALAYLTLLLRAILCGVLMYLAVSIYKEKNSVLGIVFCVPAFILAGFEHSVADMFYFAASGYRDLRGLLFLLIVIVGNAIGGMLLPLLSRLMRDEPAPTEPEMEVEIVAVAAEDGTDEVAE